MWGWSSCTAGDPGHAHASEVKTEAKDRDPNVLQLPHCRPTPTLLNRQPAFKSPRKRLVHAKSHAARLLPLCNARCTDSLYRKRAPHYRRKKSPKLVWTGIHFWEYPWLKSWAKIRSSSFSTGNTYESKCKLDCVTTWAATHVIWILQFARRSCFEISWKCLRCQDELWALLTGRISFSMSEVGPH